SGNIRVRYSFPIADYQAFVQVGAVHQAHSYASTDRVTQELVAPGGTQQCPRPSPSGGVTLNPACTTAYDDPAFTILDAAAGVGGCAPATRSCNDPLMAASEPISTGSRVEAEVRRIQALVEKREFARALADASRLLEEDPENRDVLYLIAVSQRYLGRIADAL